MFATWYICTQLSLTREIVLCRQQQHHPNARAGKERKKTQMATLCRGKGIKEPHCEREQWRGGREMERWRDGELERTRDQIREFAKAESGQRTESQSFPSRAPRISHSLLRLAQKTGPSHSPSSQCSQSSLQLCVCHEVTPHYNCLSVCHEVTYPGHYSFPSSLPIKAHWRFTLT